MRQYSFIYGQLVADDNDLIGLLAYSTYKRQKIQHIQHFVAENGREPTEEELNQFHQFTLSESQIQQYKTNAEGSINTFINNLMIAKSEDIEYFYQSSFREILKEVAKENGHGLWYGVMQGVLGSFFYTLLLGAIFLISWSMQLGPVQVIEKVFHIQISRDTTTTHTE